MPPGIHTVGRSVVLIERLGLYEDSGWTLHVGIGFLSPKLERSSHY